MQASQDNWKNWEEFGDSIFICKEFGDSMFIFTAGALSSACGLESLIPPWRRRMARLGSSPAR
jgi:hypothetical protein